MTTVYGKAIPAYFEVNPLPVQRSSPRRWGEGLHAQLVLEFKARSWVFTGSGFPELSGDGKHLIAGFLSRPHRDGKPLYVIGGSGVKGALRAVVEAITPSCDHGCRGPDLCPACQWFGATARRGAVWCSDAALTRGRLVQRRFPQRYSGKGHGRRRFYGLQSERSPATRSETVKAADAGAVFAATVIFQGISAAGAGAVTIALGLGPRGLPVLRLGGAKNRGFGAIDVELREGWWVDKLADSADPDRRKPISQQVLAKWQDAWAKEYPQGVPVLDKIRGHYTTRSGR